MRQKTHKGTAKRNSRVKYHSFKQKKQPTNNQTLLRKKLFFLITSLLVLSLGLFLFFQSTTGISLHSKIRTFNASLLTASGLTVKNISITGNNRTLSSALKKILPPLCKETSMFSLDIENIKNKIENMPWTDSVSIQRIFPNTLKVFLKEKVPLALWQDKNQLFLIDTSGYKIALKNITAFKDLPLVVGRKANTNAPCLIAVLEKTAYLKNLVRSSSFIYNRRWNLNLSNGGIIQLPEKGWKKAITNLEELHKKSNLLNKDLELIDMRVPPQIILRLKSDLAKRYKIINSPSLKKRPRSG